MTVPLIRQRAQRPKNRTGCRTCKSRHVKCDELRPSCRKCTQHGRTCGGYETSPFTSGNAARMLLPDSKSLPSGTAFQLPKYLSEFSTSLTTRQWYAIDFFRGQSSFQLPGCSMINSWETLALRLSHSDSAIQSAVIALGALHRARGADPPSSASPHLEPGEHKFALQHYSKAVSGIQNAIQQHSCGCKQSNFELILLACLLFMSFEILQGSYHLAIMHCNTGVRLLGEHWGKDHSCGDGRPKVLLKQSPDSAIDILSQAYVSIDYDLTISSGNMGPTLHAGVQGTERLLVQVDSFETLDEARTHLNAVTNAVFRVRAELEALAKQEMSSMSLESSNTYYNQTWIETRATRMQRGDGVDPQVYAQVRQVRQDVASWSSAFTAMSDPRSEEEEARRMMLQAQFASAWLISASWLGASELSYDQFYPVFRSTIGSIEHLLALRPDPQKPNADFSANNDASLWRKISRGSGILMALYIIATKCRDSDLRRQALSSLRRLKLQEGVISSDILAPCLEEIIRLEERRARPMGDIGDDRPLKCQDVPEQARFLDATINADHSDMGWVGLTISCKGNEEEWPGFVVSKEHWLFLRRP